MSGIPGWVWFLGGVVVGWGVHLVIFMALISWPDRDERSSRGAPHDLGNPGLRDLENRA